MKFPISSFQFPMFRRRAAAAPASRCPGSNWQSAIGRRKFQNGVALVVTLILLSVTLVMAIAFMAISRRSRNAANTTTDTATARLASESALSAAQAQIAATMLASKAAAYDLRLLVSTNYVDGNTTYFDSYGNLWPGGSLEYAVSNQWILPRPPVFVSTNAGSPLDFRFYLDLNRDGHFEDTGDNIPNVDYTGATNGFIPEIGDPQWIGVLEHPDQPHGPNNRFVARYAFLAQPIANSLDLNHIHNQTLNGGGPVSLATPDYFFRNEGVGTWEINLAAFLTDLNTNQWDPPTVVNGANNPYFYQRPLGFQNTGAAFEDARSLLAWRYNYSTLNLAVPSAVMNSAISGAGIDGYTVGNLMTTPVLSLPLGNNLNWAGSDNTNRYFSLMSDFFDPTKNLGNFPAHLTAAANTTGATGQPVTYDRYTLYRLLDQMGTDSTVDDDRMNLNYKNITNGVVVPGMETNCIPWEAEDFFTNAADRMLRYYTARWYAENPTNYLLTYYNVTNFPNYLGADGYGLTNFPYYGMTNQVPSFGLTNIPVYVGGRFYYSPAVNRLLQLAANMYDASTNRAAALGKDYPHVFRPKFDRTVGGDVFISGYEEIDSQAGALTINNQPLDAPILRIDDSSLTLNAKPGDAGGNVYGVPWIIGAKKGFPNFNQFYTRNIVQVTRKLEVWRTDSTVPGAVGTNQMFILSVTNNLGCSLWNSYDANYTGNLSIFVQDVSYMELTNEFGVVWPSPFQPFYSTNFQFGPISYTWQGSQWGLNSRSYNPPVTAAQTASFLPFEWKFEFLPESVYHTSSPHLKPVDFDPNPWEPISNVPVFPQFGLLTTNWLRAVILDNGHIVDYVQLSGPSSSRRLDQEIADTSLNANEQIINGTAMWETNGYGNMPPPPTKGVANQIDVSRKGPNAFTVNSYWKQPPNMFPQVKTPQAEAAFFDGFFELNNAYQVNGKVYYNTNLVVQAPYTPMRTVWQYTLWQANDPLVHYMASDLNTITKDTGRHYSDDLVTAPMSKINLSTVNERYQPWGRNKQMTQVPGLENVNVDYNAYNLSYRDPLVWGSDFWDFPTYKYPTVGWLGRVHRGTPWQTVYLKASDIMKETTSAGGNGADLGTNTWAQWTGDTQTINLRGVSHYYDAANSGPVQDGGLFDLFTTRLNDNAVRGALSVNQSHLAAWSAVLSGVVALTNTSTRVAAVSRPAFTDLTIQPAGVAGTNSPVGQIANSINNTRGNFVNPDGVKGVFEHVGDVLRSPALSEQSPFLHWTTGGAEDLQQRQYGIGEELYEWLPQQVMGLLRVGSTPRYVVYCYGQTLRPAPNGTVLSGSSFNLVTNYQVTAESAARAVIRVDRHATPTGTNYTSTVESYNVLGPE